MGDVFRVLGEEEAKSMPPDLREGRVLLRVNDGHPAVHRLTPDEARALGEALLKGAREAGTREGSGPVPAGTIFQWRDSRPLSGVYAFLVDSGGGPGGLQAVRRKLLGWVDEPGPLRPMPTRPEEFEEATEFLFPVSKARALYNSRTLMEVV